MAGTPRTVAGSIHDRPMLARPWRGVRQSEGVGSWGEVAARSDIAQAINSSASATACWQRQRPAGPTGPRRTRSRRAHRGPRSTARRCPACIGRLPGRPRSPPPTAPRPLQSTGPRGSGPPSAARLPARSSRPSAIERRAPCSNEQAQAFGELHRRRFVFAASLHHPTQRVQRQPGAPGVADLRGAASGSLRLGRRPRPRRPDLALTRARLFSHARDRPSGLRGSRKIARLSS